MIKIPWCFSCKHYSDKEPADTYKCDAFPDGIPNATLFRTPSKEQECAPGYHYEGEMEKYL